MASKLTGYAPKAKVPAKAVASERTRLNRALMVLTLSFATGGCRALGDVARVMAQNNYADQAAQALPAGRFVRLCAVSYTANYGESDPVIREVEFTTGAQLNTATNSFDYDRSATYAALWFAEDQMALVRLTRFVLIVPPFDGDDFRRIFSIHRAGEFVQVNDESQRNWTIACRDNIGRFTDPRER